MIKCVGFFSLPENDTSIPKIVKQKQSRFCYAHNEGRKSARFFKMVEKMTKMIDLSP